MIKPGESGNMLRFGFAFVIWGLLTGAWGYVWLERYAEVITQPFYFRGNVLVIVVYGLLLFFFNRFYGGYKVGYHKKGDLILSGTLALLILNAFTYAQTSLLVGWFAAPLSFVVMTAAQITLITLWGVSVGAFYSKLSKPQELLLIYGGKNLADSLQNKMLAYPEVYSVKNVINIEEGIENIFKITGSKSKNHTAAEKTNSAEAIEYQGIILCDLPSNIRNDILKHCFGNNIPAYITPKIPDILIRGAADIELFDTPLLYYPTAVLSIEQRLVKRITDITLSFIGAVIFSPLMLLIALIIKLYDGGPVLYKQIRLTKSGKQFVLYKFRSMIPNAEKNNTARMTEIDDTRITPVGKILRKFRLDELLQIFNILSGNMSIVGPRPERPELHNAYQKTMPEFEYRLKVKAGLTGLAQTVGRYNTTAYDKLRLDLAYITNYSLANDIKIILKTIKVLFTKDASEGVAKYNKRS